MYTVRVRDRMMIAHSFSGEVFGPAQALHGATFVVDVEFRRAILDGDGIVVDIGLAHEALRSILAEVNFKNLDEVPEFEGRNTTTEFMAHWVFGRMADAVRDGRLGASAEGVASIKVEIAESDVAWAGYEGAVP